MIFWVGGGVPGVLVGLGPTSWFKQIVAINVLHFSWILLNKARWARIIKEMNKIKHANH